MKKKRNKLTAIELFSGGGGLSYGLKKAGFKLVAAIEINPEFAKTYRANHKRTKVIVDDVRNLSGKDILELCGENHINLVAGCPPCQGFSSLTNKHNRDDPRDDLILEMARIVEDISPDMVLMENVPGIANRGKKKLNDFVKILKSNGYMVNYKIIQIADYGVSQSRRRLVLLAGKGFEIPFPRATHSRYGDEKKKLKSWVKLADIIKGLKKPVTLSEAKERATPKEFNWHVVSDIKPITLKRLKHLREGNDRKKLPKKLRPPCHKNNNYGFTNVYARMSWDTVSPTITRGCTTLAMGRFGHPNELRTISVMEAALIQTFPRNYVFDTEYMNQACQMVGNAFPCSFAKQLGTSCIKAFFQKNDVTKMSN